MDKRNSFITAFINLKSGNVDLDEIRFAQSAAEETRAWLNPK